MTTWFALNALSAARDTLRGRVQGAEDSTESRHSVSNIEHDWLKVADELESKHCHTWREKDDAYWLAKLMQEVGEFASALVGDHDDPLEWEAAQIAAIMRNWLKKRALEQGQGAEGAVSTDEEGE